MAHSIWDTSARMQDLHFSNTYGNSISTIFLPCPVLQPSPKPTWSMQLSMRWGWWCRVCNSSRSDVYYCLVSWMVWPTYQGLPPGRHTAGCTSSCTQLAQASTYRRRLHPAGSHQRSLPRCYYKPVLGSLTLSDYTLLGQPCLQWAPFLHDIGGIPYLTQL